MNIFDSRCVLIACAILAAGLGGCSDEPESKAPKRAASAPSTPPPAPPALSIGVTLEPRYQATLAQGIDFAKPGYPGFLKEVHGISGHEPWGRWTDATLAPTVKLRFAQALPTKFTLELRASGIGPNAFQPVRIRAGTVEKSVTLGDPPKDSYRVAFSGVEGADTIEIIPPAPILPREVSPGSTDTRKLGLGLKSIKLLD